MAFKLILAVAFVYAASAARIPQQGSDLIQRQQNSFLDNMSNNNEQLRRQDEYLRNIDHSAVSIQNPNFQQQSNRLQDNEYRRTNWLYDGNQQNRNIYQNQEQDQTNRQRPDAQALLDHLQNQLQRQLLGEPLLIAQASTNYPILRSWTSPYNSRVSFNSPLVSYRY